MSKIKLFITLLWTATAVFLILLTWVLAKLSPDTFGHLVLFYLSTLVLSFSVFTLVAFYFRRWMGVREWTERYFELSTRQGLWLAILLTLSLFLISHKWFTWLNVSFLVLALVFLESYLLTKDKQ